MELEVVDPEVPVCLLESQGPQEKSETWNSVQSLLHVCVGTWEGPHWKGGHATLEPERTGDVSQGSSEDQSRYDFFLLSLFIPAKLWISATCSCTFPLLFAACLLAVHRHPGLY